MKSQQIMAAINTTKNYSHFLSYAVQLLRQKQLIKNVIGASILWNLFSGAYI